MILHFQKPKEKLVGALGYVEIRSDPSKVLRALLVLGLFSTPFSQVFPPANMAREHRDCAPHRRVERGCAFGI